jgi:hypothetical protein
MLKRFSRFFACLLLVLMPVHALATANMLVCNSLMQSQAVKQSLSTMPCHQPMKNTQSDASDKSPCKASCASVCANMCAMTAMPAAIQSSFNNQPYVSITQPNLQRPPIAFI